MPRSRSTTRLDGRKGVELNALSRKQCHGSISTFSVTLDSGATTTTQSLSEASRRHRQQRSGVGTPAPFFDGMGNEVQQESHSEHSSSRAESRPSISSRGLNSSRCSDHTSSHRSSRHYRGRKTRNIKSPRHQRSRSCQRLTREDEPRRSNRTLTLENEEDPSFSDLSSFEQGTDQGSVLHHDISHSLHSGASQSRELTEDESISSFLSGKVRDDARSKPLQRIPSICRLEPGASGSTTTKSLRRPSMTSEEDSRHWVTSEDNCTNTPSTQCTDYVEKRPIRRKSFTLLFSKAETFHRIEDDPSSPLGIMEKVKASSSDKNKAIYSEEIKRRRRSFQGLMGMVPSTHFDDGSSHRRKTHKEGKTEKVQRRPSLGDLFVAFKGESRRGRHQQRSDPDFPHHRCHSLGTLTKKKTGSESKKGRKQRRPSFKNILNANQSVSEEGLLDSDCSSPVQERTMVHKIHSFRKQKGSDERCADNGKLRHSRGSHSTNRRSDTRDNRDCRKKRNCDSYRYEGGSQHASRSSNHHRSADRSSDHHRHASSRDASSSKHSSSYHKEQRRSRSRTGLSGFEERRSSHGHSSRHQSRSDDRKRSHSRPRVLMDIIS